MPIRSPHNRQGALPLHLTLTMLPWIASNAALRLSQSGLNVSSMPPQAVKLKEAWRAVLENPLFAQAMETEARSRVADFLQGLCLYQQASFSRDADDPPVACTHGGTRLLDYGGGSEHAPTVLLIPSLINRYYIIDLTQKLSFARFLRRCGMRVLVVDWGMPSEAERFYNSGMYVTETLVPLAEWARTHTQGKIVLAGYCMGGLLGLALAQIRPDLADGCALLATPWDFFAGNFPRMALTEKEVTVLAGYIDGQEELPAETIHTLFHYANPYAFQKKLREFARMHPDSEATQEFLAVEHWVNDGVPMTRGVARDCLIEWTQRNTPATGQWRVGGQAVDPRKLSHPCFVAAPREDRIVPSGCALPLVPLLRNCTVIEPCSGHVGMMVGSRRRQALWEPFAKWTYSQFT